MVPTAPENPMNPKTRRDHANLSDTLLMGSILMMVLTLTLANGLYFLQPALFFAGGACSLLIAIGYGVEYRRTLKKVWIATSCLWIGVAGTQFYVLFR